MNNSRMSPLDSIWLFMEAPDTPMHVGVLALFSLPRNASDSYLSELAESMRSGTEISAPWNQRLKTDPLSRLAPALEDDPEVELEYHFRHSALPAPGGEKELGVIVSRLHSNALDRNRPLWEFHLIEGLENNRFAFYLKIHRALVENINAIPVLTATLSASARSRHQPPPWAAPLPISQDQGLQRDFDPASILRSAGKATMDALKSRVLRNNGSSLLPDSAPYSTLNRHISAQRRFATWQLEQSRIAKLAQATDSTVNEILTYLCSSSLRRFFKEYNALPDDSLIGLIPISLQERGEHIPGGAIATLRVELGTHIGTSGQRLRAIKESMQKVREDRSQLPDDAAASYALMRAAPLLISQLPTIGRMVPPLFNVHVSNSPSSDAPLYYNGARLDAIYPMNQLMQLTALSINCVSYAGTLNIGFCGARETLPHLQRLAVYLGRALEDLEEITYHAEESQ